MYRRLDQSVQEPPTIGNQSCLSIWFNLRNIFLRWQFEAWQLWLLMVKSKTHWSNLRFSTVNVRLSSKLWQRNHSKVWLSEDKGKHIEKRKDTLGRINNLVWGREMLGFSLFWSSDPKNKKRHSRRRSWSRALNPPFGIAMHFEMLSIFFRSYSYLEDFKISVC